MYKQSRGVFSFSCLSFSSLLCFFINLLSGLVLRLERIKSDIETKSLNTVKYFYTISYACGHKISYPTMISVFDGEEHIKKCDCPECLKLILSRVNLDSLRNELLEVCL